MARSDDPDVRQGVTVLSSPARERYRAVRQASEALTRALTPEDQLAQSMPDASPTKWHLAHTTWFFETFLVAPHAPDYRPFDSRFGYLFNSYYEALGPRQPGAVRYWVGWSAAAQRCPPTTARGSRGPSGVC